MQPVPVVECRECGRMCRSYGAYMMDADGDTHCPRPPGSSRTNLRTRHLPSFEYLRERQGQVAEYARLRASGASVEEATERVYGKPRA